MSVNTFPLEVFDFGVSLSGIVSNDLVTLDEVVVRSLLLLEVVAYDNDHKA